MARTQKGLKRRDEIVDQVMKLLNHLDLKHATVRAICEETGISVGTFYHYFPDKNDLLAEILGRIDLYLAQQVAPSLRHRDELKNLMEFAMGFARYTSGIGNATGSIISTADVPLPHTAQQREAEQKRLLYALPRQILLRGQQKGQIRADLDADRLTDQLIIILRGHALEWARRRHVYSVEEKISDFMQLFLDMIRKK